MMTGSNPAVGAEPVFLTYPMLLRNLITELQSRGIRVPDVIPGRSGGAGPAEGRSFLVGGVPVNVPISAAYTADSPFTLSEEGTGRYRLLKNDRPLAAIFAVPVPRFYDRADSEKVPYKKIALLHGSDCLATTVLQTCVNWKNDRRCAFCATQVSLEKNATIARKTPGQLAEVARAAVAVDGVAHVVLTSGTAEPARLGNCIPGRMRGRHQGGRGPAGARSVPAAG